MILPQVKLGTKADRLQQAARFALLDGAEVDVGSAGLHPRNLDPLLSELPLN